MEFQTVLKYIKDLKFEDEPDYSFMKGQFKNLFDANKFTYDLKFDWMTQSSIEEKKAFVQLANHETKFDDNSIEKDNERKDTGDNLVPIFKKPKENHQAYGSGLQGNQDRTVGSTILNRPPALPESLTRAPIDAKRKQIREAKTCGCNII